MLTSMAPYALSESHVFNVFLTGVDSFSIPHELEQFLFHEQHYQLHYGM